jgi:hypothetical protein
MPDDKKYGALRGKYIEPVIATDIKGQLDLIQDANKIFSQMLTAWKTFKVVDNPASHMRNMYFNLGLSDVAGLSPLRMDIYIPALIEVWKKTGDFVEANNLGVFGTTFVSGELNNILTKGLGDDLNKVLETVKRADGTYDYSALKTNAINVASKAKQVYDNIQKVLGDIYQGEEMVNKLALYKFAKQDKGMLPQDAARFAKKWGLNYNAVTPWIKAFGRKPWGMPFITFQVVLAPLIAEAIVTRSMSMLKIFLALYLMEETARKTIGWSRKQLRAVKQKVMPTWMQNGLYILSPVLNEDGNPEFLDF